MARINRFKIPNFHRPVPVSFDCDAFQRFETLSTEFLAVSQLKIRNKTIQYSFVRL